MRIANPIYDAVFKFFMEDPEVAKRLISNIIGQEVVSKRWQLEFEDYKNIADPDLQLFVKRLWIAVQNQKVQEEIRAEQELDKHFIDMSREIEVKDQIILAKDSALAEKDSALAEKDSALAEAEQQKITTTKNFIALGMSVAVVAKARQVSEKDVQKWLKL